MGRVKIREMLVRCLLITLLSSILFQTYSAVGSSSDFGHQNSDDAWLESLLGLTTRDLRSDKDKEMFWATRGKRMMDTDDFWATRGKKAAMEGASQIKRSLKPNGLFSSIKRAGNSLKRPFLKPNGLFGSFKRNFKPNGLFSTFKRGVQPEAVYNYDEDELSDSELLYNLGREIEKREDFWAARG